MRSTRRSLLVLPPRSGKPWVTGARRSERSRARTRSAVQSWEAGKVVFVVSTGWVGRHTCLASKWTGVAEIASANWSLPESADVPSVHMLYPLLHLLSALVLLMCVHICASWLSHCYVSRGSLCPGFIMLFGLLSLVWVCNSFVCTHIVLPLVWLVHVVYGHDIPNTKSDHVVALSPPCEPMRLVLAVKHSSESKKRDLEVFINTSVY